MRTFTLLITLCLGLAGMAFGSLAPPCAAASYSVYEGLPSGCAIGDTGFTNFSTLMVAGNIGGQKLTSDNILVVPSSSSDNASLTFMYVDGNGLAAPITLGGLGQNLNIEFTYLVLTSSSSITSAKLLANYSNNTPASVSNTMAAVSNTGQSYTSMVNSNGASNPAGMYAGNNDPVSGGTSFTITDSSSLQSQTGIATLSSVTNSFTLDPPPTLASATDTMPEPRTLSLIAVGLVYVVCLRRKRVNSQSTL